MNKGVSTNVNVAKNFIRFLFRIEWTFSFDESIYTTST